MRTLAKRLENSSVAFGTSGLRGLADELSDEIVAMATQASLIHMQRVHGLTPEKTIYVGQDLRPSSPRIAQTVCGTARAMGYGVHDAGVVPTPAIALAALDKQCPAIMVTGSHIPFDRNGIKFYMPEGEASKADEEGIMACSLEALKPADSSHPKDCQADVEAHYLARYTSAFGHVMEGLRVGLYQHSAAGRDITARLFKALGGDVIILRRSDSFVPIDTEAVAPIDQQRAKDWVKEHNLDLLFTTDGDGDRPLLADEKGTWFRGDALCILAGYALGINHMVTPVSSSTALEKSGWFETTSRTRIGSPHVIAAMEEAAKSNKTSVAGFEANGGFMLGSDLEFNDKAITALPTRDAILPALCCLHLAHKHKATLSHLHTLLPPRATASDRLENTPTQRSKTFITMVQADSKTQSSLLPVDRHVNYIDQTDGLRMTLDDETIIHLRPSGNAPELRIYGEAETQSEADALVAATKEKLMRLLA